MPELKIRFYTIIVKQGPPSPAWTEVAISTPSNDDYRMLLYPEDFCQLASFFNSFRRYELKHYDENYKETKK